MKKINDVAIQMSSFKMTPSELVEQLLTIDDYLNEEQLTKLILMSPNEEEEKILKESISIADELSKQEQFLIHLLKVPNLKTHLQCINFKLCFYPNFLKLNNGLKVLRKSIEGIAENYELE